MHSCFITYFTLFISLLFENGTDMRPTWSSDAFYEITSVLQVAGDLS